MRSWLRSHLTYANVISTLALVLVLGGGTTLAATGGNFILGKSNSAGAPTRLSSSTTDPAGVLKVTSTATSGGRAIQGTSNTGQGVYGYSSQNAGVVGESLNLDGVYGVSNSASHAAVSAHNDVWGGYGLWAAGGDRANNTAAIHGTSAKGNAIQGYSTANPASGVYGQDNTANSYGVAGHSNNGVAVAGDSSNGWAMQALGNATQSRAGYGFAKAMAFINPADINSGIYRCFNSQVPANQSTVNACGISFGRPSAGHIDVDFGFDVSDRFVAVTSNAGRIIASGATGSGLTGDASIVHVTTFNTSTNAYANWPFTIIVF